ncbi:MAG: hypothetical protein ACRC2T_00395 [Thermoguttaceae bacterium]
MVPPRFSQDDIKRIQNLESGWENTWNSICTELLGHSEKGRLFRAVQVVSKRDPEFVDEVVSYIIGEIHRAVHKQTLFASYDADRGDVFAFLCNRTIVHNWLSRYRKHYLCTQTISLNHQSTRNKHSNELELGNYIDNKKPIGDATRNEKLSNILAAFEAPKITLNIDENKKIDRVSEHAGLQLFRRLDATMIWLHNHVVNVVEKSFPSTSIEQIESEHDLAETRIAKQQKYYEQKLFSASDQRFTRVLPKTRNELDRKIVECQLEKLFFPLIAEQIMCLFSLARNNADKILSRYRAKLPELLPCTEENNALLTEFGIFKQKGSIDD